MSSEDPVPPQWSPTSALLRTAYNVLAAHIYEAVVTGTAVDDLRPAHGNVMEQLEMENGLRLTVLAARAGMTAQSMGELVDDLERKGYLTRRPDPDDRRAKRIYLTGRGRENVRVAKLVIGELEACLRETLGAERYSELRGTLETIIHAFPRDLILRLGNPYGISEVSRGFLIQAGTRRRVQAYAVRQADAKAAMLP